MKRYIYALAVATILSSPAMAAKIGVSMDKFDDNFLTVLRNGMSAYAKTLPDVSLQIEDAKDDISKQLSQVQNFIANKVDAIIVNPVNTSATPAITKLATEAGVPIVYVNRQPTTSVLWSQGRFRRFGREAVRDAGKQRDLSSAQRQRQHGSGRTKIRAVGGRARVTRRIVENRGIAAIQPDVAATAQPATRCWSRRCAGFRLAGHHCNRFLTCAR